VTLLFLAPLACNGDRPAPVPSPAPTFDSGGAPTPTWPTPERPTQGIGGDALGPRFESGSRLQARSIGPSGGADRVFAYFEDSDLGVPCAFRLATDGILRCLPLADRLVETIAYVDAGCTEPAQAYACGDVRYRLEATPQMRDDPCELPQTVYEVREVEPVAGALYVDDGGCAPLTAGVALVGGRDGAVVPPSRFVSATIEERRTVQGVGVRDLVAEDGARLRQGLFVDPDGPCRIRYLEGLGPRCVPDNAAIVGAGPGVSWWWSSPSCDDGELAYTASSVCDEPPVRVALEFATLDAPRLHRVGAPFTGPTAWDDRLGTCDATDVADTPWTLHPVVGPGTATTLAPLTLEVVEGSPVGFAWFVDEFGLRVAEGFFEGRLGRSAAGPFETDAGAPCRGVLTADGAARCVPAGTRTLGDDAIRTFRDDACTEELVPVSTEVPERVALAVSDVCGVAADGLVVVDVREVGSAIGGGELYVVEPGDATCRPADRQPGFGYHRLGDSQIDDLAPLTVE